MRTMRLPSLAAVALLAGCAAAGAPASRPAPAPPPVMREFRGVWVATVANIDWPSKPGLAPDSQRAELLAILDRAAELRLNAVVLQVRPAGDALYASPLEPWSEYLTGESGRAPEPRYDPLEFAVAEAHRRGMELHAWFNPYRARHPSARTPLPAGHIGRERPELVRPYGAYLWMDPGEPEVRAHSLRVILDVVRRYDVDGVHVDDYFYPYPERDSAGRVIDFPDEPSWTRYVQGGGQLSRGDWRRENVNGLIRDIYRGIKREKPWVKFGISPFGVYRPNHPPGLGTAFDQYESLYADARRWLAEGWMDYFTPQLYWPSSRPDLSYPLLLRWWTEQNARGRHMWPGNFTSRVVEAQPRPWPATEVVAQVFITRAIPGATGNVHFSMRAFQLNPDSLVEKLRAGPYGQPALIPASPWLGGRRLPAPVVAVPGDGSRPVVTITPRGEVPATWWVVRARWGTRWTLDIVPGVMREHALTPPPDAGELYEVRVMPIDRVGTEGREARWAR
ncbi:MAG TPA: family 10 glycosylhydrolase [Longimicrobium sp.]|nr:family 10 glycosylhydrolase [Longimicrobium sp.]